MHDLQRQQPPIPSPQEKSDWPGTNAAGINDSNQNVSSSRKRVRRGSNVKRHERSKRKAALPFAATNPDDNLGDQSQEPIITPDSATGTPTLQPLKPQDPSITVSSPANAAGTPEEKTHFCFIPKYRRVDPKPNETITTPETLAQHYRKVSYGTCIIAPKDQQAFCKVKFVPFSSMTPSEIKGWEKLVVFFFYRMNYVDKVKNNGPLMGGDMWADGWRKCSKKGEAFGRYCSVVRLARMIMLANYNQDDEAAAIREANDWIASQLQQLAPGVFQAYRQILINNNLPSMAHMEYQTTYNAFDFASFYTFTMNNFFNGPHHDGDANRWTLVCWIPIFNPKTCQEEDGILADKYFDMTGGEFTFRDFQVYLDLNKTSNFAGSIAF
ncbi:uncharacterized protein PGTG_09785 [Puccinia graminis f. sp. tritici CRL 75-36-700-3]|uniref:Tet-like 2OG-Fe(II) oxygenase domain-containing protein n=1 Tax=Puccinia graminis f. sp. tritici (strain CRL 75-36-700-3 / race SCCL) TaxID=418459 RepID=E3KEU2_PUCGT|nr:uncharacterized protein PGTG_09785 [Puccinia graminis f. sp. tritici CRL 75-36-700-3]EFP82817.2 hypothetical protein PGTG_09785 [Puccinia graminis f. sp. tritici CRL 75-36-700-3]